MEDKRLHKWVISGGSATIVVEVDNLDASLELFRVIFRNGKCDSFIYKFKGLFMHFL